MPAVKPAAPLNDLEAGARFAAEFEERKMNRFMFAAAIVLAAGATAVTPAIGKGCLKGAAAGAVVGHIAGHHGKAGAAAGCVAGHHHAAKKARKR